MYNPAEHLQKIIYESIVAGLPEQDVAVTERFIAELAPGRDFYDLFLQARSHLSFLYAQNGRREESFEIDLELLRAVPRGPLSYSNILAQAMKSAQLLDRPGELLPLVLEFLGVGGESKVNVQALGWLARHFPKVIEEERALVGAVYDMMAGFYRATAPADMTLIEKIIRLEHASQSAR